MVTVTDDDSGNTGWIESVSDSFILTVTGKNYAPIFSQELSDLTVNVGSAFLYSLPAIIDINLDDVFTFELDYSSGNSFNLLDFSVVTETDDGVPQFSVEPYSNDMVGSYTVKLSVTDSDSVNSGIFNTFEAEFDVYVLPLEESQEGTQTGGGVEGEITSNEAPEAKIKSISD